MASARPRGPTEYDARLGGCRSAAARIEKENGSIYLIAQKFVQMTRSRVKALVMTTAALACLAGATQGAFAVTTFSPFAAVDVQHNSNVFALWNDDLLGPRASFSDTITHYTVGGTADFKWGPDTVSVNAEGTRYQYQHNTLLNHNESKFGGLFDWRLSAIFSGVFQYEQAKMMTPLGDTLSQQLELQTDRVASGEIRALLTPRWRIDLEPKWHELDSPLVEYPQFGYSETSLAASINYLGIQKLSAGLRGQYLDGSFHHIIDATNYHQKIAQLTANYAITGFSSLDGQLGYTWRDASLANPADAGQPGGVPAGTLGTTKAVTGALGINRKLSVKTAFNLKLFREVESYQAGANPSISTGGEGSIVWQPDFRISASLHYRLARQSIQGTQAIANFTGRSDRTQDLGVTVKYQALHWLSVRPYYTRQLRSSNLAPANYNATVVGVEFTAQLNQQKK